MSTLAPGKKPRLFRIGPGLVLAVAASLLVWRYWEPTTSAPPIKTNFDTSVAAPVVTDSPPDPTWLLQQKEALQLDAAQFEKLNRLKARWEVDTKELRAALERASNEFQRGMESGRGAKLQELQERAAPVSELTQRLTAARRVWWSVAAGVLDAEQRQRAEKLWSRRFLSENKTNVKNSKQP